MKVFPVYYFPPISWFAAIQSESQVMLEAREHYRKQQYFNRMRIKGPNGVMALSIPVEKAPEKTPLAERRIAYAMDWQKNHWKSLEAGYRSSPYFEYYEDRLLPFYEQRWDNLLEFNLASIALCVKLLDLDLTWEVSSEYKDSDQYSADYRSTFNARKGVSPSGFTPQPYEQVFPGFAPDLSLLDLLFNEGPAARQILNGSFIESV